MTIGPWIDNGFYYDFDTGDTRFTEDDLKSIKKEMERIIKARLPLRREEVRYVNKGPIRRGEGKAEAAEKAGRGCRAMMWEGVM